MILQKFSELSSAPFVDRATRQYLIVLAKIKYRTIKEYATRKPKITHGELELIITANDTMERLVEKIKTKKSLKDLVEVLDLEIISEHGYTNLPDQDTNQDINVSKSGFSLRDYQRELVENGVKVLKANHIVIYAQEMRTGKTHVSLETCARMGFKNVLFMTPLKAIPSIEEDYAEAGHDFKLTTLNYEKLKGRIDQLEKENYDVVICDEFHKIGSSFPKPSQKAQLLKRLVSKGGGLPVIFLSGTPTPESYSQIFHSLYVTPQSPFREYKNFYRWADDYVNKYTIKVAGRDATKYDRAKEDKVVPMYEHLIVSYTQKEADFKWEVIDKVHHVTMKKGTYALAEKIKTDLVYEPKSGGAIVGDTPAGLMGKLHQIYSGTVLKTMDDGSEEAMFFDDSKIQYIKNEFKGQRIAILYKFKEEGRVLAQHFPNSTDNPEEFREGKTDYFISQLTRVAEGVNLATADALVFYSIDFSSRTYIQSRQRLQTIDRETQPVAHFIFATGGIEDRVYKVVKSKQNFTKKYYEL